MKLRKIEPNTYEYDWQPDSESKEGKVTKYAIVLDNSCVIAMFSSLRWAQLVIEDINYPRRKMEIMEVVDEH